MALQRKMPGDLEMISLTKEHPLPVRPRCSPHFTIRAPVSTSRTRMTEGYPSQKGQTSSAGIGVAGLTVFGCSHDSPNDSDSQKAPLVETKMTLRTDMDHRWV